MGATSNPAVRFVAMGHVSPVVCDALPTQTIYRPACRQAGFPRTYGAAIVAAWKRHKRPARLTVVEQDIAIDPRHLAQIQAIASDHPRAVIAVPYVLWTASTGREEPCWAHRNRAADGSWMYRGIDKPCPKLPDAFGLGCTSLPADLLAALEPLAEEVVYPTADTRVSALAEELRLPVFVTSLEATHLHWSM